MKKFFVNAIFCNTQKVFLPTAANAADAICMAIDMMECEGVDLQKVGMVAMVAKPDDGSNGYMASFDQEHYFNGDYEVVECVPA